MAEMMIAIISVHCCFEGGCQSGMGISEHDVTNGSSEQLALLPG